MYYVISNPVSGRSKTNKIAETVKAELVRLNIEHEWIDTKYVNHPTIIASEIDKANPDGGLLIIIGGDGTFHEVLNGISDLSKWKIGFIPAGSGNDLATKLGLSKKDPLGALKKVLDGNIKKIDYIKVNERTCVNVAGTGIDIDILQRFERYSKLKGKFRYLVALLVTLCVFKWYKFKVSIDGEDFVEKEGFIVALGNGSQYGGGIPITPLAVVDDGLLEYIYVQKIKRIKIPLYLIKLMKGKVNTVKGAEYRRVKRIVFEKDEDFLFNMDGQIIKGKRFDCQIVEHGLQIYL